VIVPVVGSRAAPARAAARLATTSSAGAATTTSGSLASRAARLAVTTDASGQVGAARTITVGAVTARSRSPSQASGRLASSG
jgi:hypothetical protein